MLICREKKILLTTGGKWLVLICCEKKSTAYLLVAENPAEHIAVPERHDSLFHN
jgi:hypothetical protein